jgi:hypothetical protein
MKKTLLASILCGASALAFGQRSVGHTKAMQRPAMDASRALDTIGSSIFNSPDVNLVLYGVVPPPQGPGGYILGTNGYNDAAKAQAFLLDQPTAVKEILYWFGAKSAASGSPNSRIRCRIWAMNGPGSTTAAPNGTYQYAPGTVLGEVLMNVSQVSDPDPGGFLTWTAAVFPTPVWVNIEFAAGITLNELASADTVALVSSENGQVGIGEQCWEKWSQADGGGWYTLPAAGWGGGTFDIDAFIFVVIDDAFQGIDETGSLNRMRLSFLNGNVSNGNVLIGYDVLEAGRMDLMVHDARGRLVFERFLGNQGEGTYTHGFSTEGWSAGDYYLTLKNNGRPFTKKFVVAK